MPRAERRVEIHIPSDSPEWLKAAVRALRELLALEEDWDRQGAHQVRAEAVVLALNLLDAVMDEALPSPWIVPRPNGGLQLEWDREGSTVEVVISPDGERFIVCAGDEEWDGSLADIDRLYADLRAIRADEATSA